MIVAATKMTFEEFLAYEDDTEGFYELENGELIAMPTESEVNRRIAMFLVATFLELGIPFEHLSLKTELAVISTRVSVRIPDLVVFSEDCAIALEGATRSLVRLEMPPPMMVVEVVSAGQENRDYRYKRSEYASRGIAEYWIVNPMEKRVTVLEWVEGFYEEKTYRGEDAIYSPLLTRLDVGQLSLTANQVLQDG